MLHSKPIQRVVSTLRGAPCQTVAALLCVCYGIALIMNVELEGDGSWFWYAKLIHQGVRLYADLNFPQQPLFVLETSAWMQLVGQRCIPYEMLAVLHVLTLCGGLRLVLRESRWPDWQKAIILFASFVLTSYSFLYRFDDFHVVNDILVVYSLWLLLLLAREDQDQRQMGLVAALGVLSGLAFTNRLNDGGALLAMVFVCAPFVARRRKAMMAGLFVVAAALAALLIVRLTGDSFRDYLLNAILHAASAKGGTSTVLHGPIAAVKDNLSRLLQGRRTVVLWMAVLAAVGFAAQRYGNKGDRYVVAVELLFAGVSLGLLSRASRGAFLNGELIDLLSTIVQLLVYVLSVVVAFRYIRSRLGHGEPPWDARTVLILVLVGQLMSFATSQVNGSSNSYQTLALLLLLVPVWQPFGAQARWANPTCVALALLLGVTGLAHKIRTPYTWGGNMPPMFQSRQWYHHQVYGPMYMDRDLLNFVEPICAEIRQGNDRPELLTLPYSYPNYFCAVPPWKGYVQTWFDTTQPETIRRLMGQLDTDPPQWILYQRQMEVIRIHEVVFGGGHPMPQRHLDEMILQKIASGKWQVVDERHYLAGDGWYLIRTHP